MRRLIFGRRNMLFIGSSLFLGSWCGNSAARSTVEAGVARVVNSCIIRDICDVRNVCHIGYRTVNVVNTILPSAANKAGTAIATAIIHAAIETDMGTPVAFMPQECIATPTPIAGSPQDADNRRLYPCARNPEIVVFIPKPVGRATQYRRSIGGDGTT